MENKSKIHIPLENTKNKQKPIKWAKSLDDYSNYVKEYIKHYNKSLAGNPVSLAKYPYMKIRSESLAAQLEKAKDKSILTEKQIKRLCKINLKIDSAY